MKKILLFTFFSIYFGSGLVAQPVYKDVAKIIYNRCGTCHNPYSHGANFIGYHFASSNAQGMKAHLKDGTMPPWLPDTTYGHRFVNEYIITASEKDLLLKWIDAGFPAGDTTLAPTPPKFSKYYINKKADLELSIGQYTSTAQKQDNYVCFALPTGLTEDRIVKACEIVIGNPSIVHHVLVGVDTTGQSKTDLSGNCYNVPGQYGITGFAPGELPVVFPNRPPLKSGIRIKAGSQIVLQIHYPIKSDGKMDSTKVRLFFYPKEEEKNVRHVYTATCIQKWLGLNIPANKIVTFTESNETVIPGTGSMPKWGYDASLLAITPHSHAICTFIECVAKPDKGVQGNTIPLIRINKWDFNREGHFHYRRLLKIPKDYYLESTHTYNNTDGNFANPNHPPKDIKAGPATGDEMLFDSFTWLKYEPGDELINIDSLITTDPLLSGVNDNIINNKLPESLETYCFPNPFRSNITIGYNLEKSSSVEIAIWSINGKVVKMIKKNNEMPGKHEFIWNGVNDEGNTVASGEYFYTIKADNKLGNGKITFIK